MSQLLGGRYRLGDMIGTGGMADVYEANDERLSRKVAVKILRSDLAKDPSFVTRFRKEALAAAGLNHPGIVAVYDSGEEPAPYIVLEIVSGKTLRGIIRAGERLPLDRALEIGEGILAALDYSHERGIVHRDIKPANVMITDKGDVKVMILESPARLMILLQPLPILGMLLAQRSIYPLNKQSVKLLMREAIFTQLVAYYLK